MISIGAVCGNPRRFWRPTIAAVAAFAVAAQMLLIGIGLTIPARADVGISTFELCQHDAQDVPDLPSLRSLLRGRAILSSHLGD
jgi:hypothetical protein